MKRPEETVGRTTRRTRSHIIADFSVHHVEGFVLRQGHVVERFRQDYGYDLTVHTFDYSYDANNGEFEPEFVNLQLKATDSLTVWQGKETIAFAGITRRPIRRRHFWSTCRRVPA